jgi:hypothetical protein
MTAKTVAILDLERELASLREYRSILDQRIDAFEAVLGARATLPFAPRAVATARPAPSGPAPVIPIRRAWRVRPITRPRRIAAAR